jgi:hypothetical protein
LVAGCLTRAITGWVMGTGSSVLRKCFEDEVLHDNVDHDTTSLYQFLYPIVCGDVFDVTRRLCWNSLCLKLLINYDFHWTRDV